MICLEDNVFFQIENIRSAMALSTPSYAFSPVCNPSPRGISCSSFLPAGLHSSSSSPFARNGAESLSLSSWQRRHPVCPRQRSVSINALFGLGVPELVVIAGVAALIFGPKKLPEIGKSLGKTVKSFQEAAKEFEAEVKQGGGDSVSTESSKTEVLSSTAGPEKERENSEV